MALLLAAIGSLIGILGMTLLFPSLASILHSNGQHGGAKDDDRPNRVAILIPAYNEQKTLPRTLSSISDAIEQVRRSYDCSFRIVVGADGCTDNTAAIANQMGAQTLVTPARVGKWATILQLVAESRGSEWVIFVDSGVEWSSDFLMRLLPMLSSRDIMGVAPSYRNDTAGVVERFIWRIESKIKELELRCGGPVSVHGATVCYRLVELSRSLAFLSRRSWLNDDVVIPLALRALYPTKRLLYVADLVVKESGIWREAHVGEFTRRRRLVFGNIEWIQHLWSRIIRRNYTVGILAGRRIFRLLWAYWAGLLTCCLALAFDRFQISPAFWLSLSIISMAAIFVLKPLRVVLESGLASLLAPYFFLMAIFRPTVSLDDVEWS